MADTSYFCLGGIELSNACRTIAYAANGLKPHTTTFSNCCCVDLPAMLGDDDGYSLPHLDDAPWFDPADLDSIEFGGLLITRIEGLDTSPVERQVTNRIGDGATIGRRRRGPRVITVTGILTGSTCAGVAYGVRWLSAALQGSLACAPGAGCGGDDLTYLDHCPEICEDAPGFVSYEACAEPVFRTLRDVALTSGPTITEEIGGACACCDNQCGVKQVEFVLTAGRPHALRAPVVITDGQTWGPPDPDPECIEWSSDPACVSEDDVCDQTVTDCVADPRCPTVTPPSLPLPDNPCICDPLVRRELCIAVPADTVPIWADQVPQLSIYAGANPLRGIRIRFYPNPLGLTIDGLSACGYCSEINVSYLPASSTFDLDGTRRRATVTCPGRDEAPAGGVLYGPQGLPFQWPVLDCGSPYLVCVSADDATIAPDATVSLSLVTREV